MHHTHINLHVAFTKTTNGPSLGTFGKPTPCTNSASIAQSVFHSAPPPTPHDKFVSNDMKRQHFTCLKQFRYNKRIWYFKDQSSEINILLQQANVQLVCKFRSQRTCAKRFGLSHVAKPCAVLKQITVVTAPTNGLVTATRPSVILYAQHRKTKY
jgi:hypothetical protein